MCVLGSATPSLESRHNVELGKLELLELPARVGGGGALPTVEIVDLRARAGMAEAQEARPAQRRRGPGVVLSAPLVEAMAETLASGEQVLLFLNRRGYSSAILCETCGTVEQCPHCSVTLTLHRRRNALVLPPVRPRGACRRRARVRQRGAARSSASAPSASRPRCSARFPDARVARLDRDSA